MWVCLCTCQNSHARSYIFLIPSLSGACSSSNSAPSYDSVRHMYAPVDFNPIAYISSAPIFFSPFWLLSDCCRLFSSVEKSWKPKRPRRVMYARFLGSETPVAEQYSTRASGSACWMATTASAVLVGGPVELTRFFAWSPGRGTR